MAKRTKQPRHKHVPQRSCVVCRQKFDKRVLTRVVCSVDVESAESTVSIDPTGKRNGRGAYLCNDSACWDKALQRNTLDIALKTKLTEAEKAIILNARSQLKPVNMV